MEITEGLFETLLKKEGVDCDKKRDWIDSDFATVFKVVESLIKNHGVKGDVSTMLIAFEQWKIDGDVKNLLPKQIVEWYIEESNL